MFKYLLFAVIFEYVSAAAQITPMWTGLRLKSYDTSTCLYKAASGSFQTSTCDTADSFLFKEQTPSGFAFTGWFQFTTKSDGYGTHCLQAGSKTGYSQSSNGDKAVWVACVGDEPTQIWKNHDYSGGYFQYEDLGSGKCLCLDKASGQPVMWDCNYYADNHWWSAVD